jgi:hypothetical protein
MKSILSGVLTGALSRGGESVGVSTADRMLFTIGHLDITLCVADPSSEESESLVAQGLVRRP